MSKNEKIRNSKDPNANIVADDLDAVAAISVLVDIEGGKLLVKSLLKDVIGAMEELGAKYRTLTVQEFIGICADMQSKLDLARVLARSKKNKEYLEAELERMLKEEEGG